MRSTSIAINCSADTASADWTTGSSTVSCSVTASLIRRLVLADIP
ncbi:MULTISPECIES: hypothetical protein [Streptomyces]|nr:hypothetical protein [Streptomyces sp. NBRC 13847]